MGRSRGSAVRTVIAVTAVEMVLAVVIRGWAALNLAGIAGASAHQLLATFAILWLPVQAWALAWLVKDCRQLRDSQDRTDHMLRSLATTTHDWLWEIDRRGVITYASPGCRDMFGYEPEEVVGRPAAFLLHPSAGKQVVADFQAAVESGEGWLDQVVHCVAKDGGDLYVTISGVPIVDRKGVLLGHQGTARRLGEDGYQQLRSLKLRRQVERAIADDALSVALQPIVSLTTDRVTGVEALARFSADPHQPPDRWFADAAAVGLGTPLELFAVSKALEAGSGLPHWMYLSINASPRAITSPELVDLMRGLGPRAGGIVIEITEHESIDDYGAMTRARADLRALGVRLAVDDAGAGFASFRHILRLQPDIIKLDRALISGIDTDLARRALAASMVLFSMEVGATVVAEGVETAAELATVMDLGIDAAQGYHIGRPSRDRRDWERWSRPHLQLVDLTRTAETA
jgi:PAS domain S-box-containing protein